MSRRREMVEIGKSVCLLLVTTIVVTAISSTMAALAWSIARAIWRVFAF